MKRIKAIVGLLLLMAGQTTAITKGIFIVNRKKIAM